MPAATEESADLRHINLWRLGTQADTDAPVAEFFKERCRHDPIDRANVIDQPLIILRDHPQLGRRLESEREARHAVAAGEAKHVEQSAQQFEPAPRITLVHLLREVSDVDSRTD